MEKYSKPTSYQRRKKTLTDRQMQIMNTSSYLINNFDNEKKASFFHEPIDTSIEIGFGGGEHLLMQAQNQPHIKHIGIDLYRAGIYRMIKQQHESPLKNLYLWEIDASDIIEHIGQKKFIKINIYHPDPWPKKRQHKRRLIQTDFIKTLLTTLDTNGTIEILSDHEDYTAHIYHTLLNIDDTMLEVHQNIEPKTKYGQKARSEKRQITQFILKNMDQPTAPER